MDDAGFRHPGAERQRPLSPLRVVLLSGVAVCGIMAYSARTVRAQTVPPNSPCNGGGGGTVVCTNVANGVRLNNGGGPVTTLVVNNPDVPIAPSSNVDGIQFTSSVALTISSNTGVHGISTTGSAQGIEAFSSGGSVTIVSTGNITTLGISADGIQAMADNAGAISVTNIGNISTASSNAEGIYARSHTAAVTVNSTGNITAGGAEGDGIVAISTTGAVTVTSTGNITTTGSGAEGILVDSDGSVSVTSTGNVTTTQSISDALYAQSRDAGNVTVTSTGNLSTNGIQSEGIFARSLGGGAVTVESSGNISTAGQAAEGILAQSAGGPITVTSSGNISTSGGVADGIFARSTAAGVVMVDVSGSIVATGSGANGVRAFSSTGDTTVTITSGSDVAGGTGLGAGVSFSGAGAGTDNKLVNHGVLSAGSGLAIQGGAGNDVIDNSGVVTGNVLLSTGDNAFINRWGGVLNAGATVDLGTANLLTNDGRISPGGEGSVLTTALTGNILQQAMGRFLVDVNPGTTADRLSVTGSADLSGTVVVNMLAMPTALSQQYTILSADGGVTDNGLTAEGSTLAFTVELLYPDTQTVVLGTTVDFSFNGLNRNQTAIGDHLNASFAAGSAGLNPVFLALINMFDPGAYRSALDQLSPEIYNAAKLSAFYANDDFTNNLLSCRVNGVDAASIMREGQCLWIGGRARFLDGDQTRENIGFDETAGMFAAGGQTALDSVWRFGFGVGYQTSALTMDSGAKSDGDQAHGGVVLKYNPGSLLLAAAVTGGYGWYDTTRPISFGGFSATAKGDYEIGFLTGRLHASYLLGTSQLYAKPMLDVSWTQLDITDVRETGAGGAGIVVAGHGEAVASIAPAILVGTQWELANGAQMRPFVKVGFTWLSSDEFTLDASFTDTPAGVSPFTIGTAVDDIRADIGVGIEVVSRENGTLRLHYDGHFGERTELHSIGLRGSSRF